LGATLTRREPPRRAAEVGSSPTTSRRAVSVIARDDGFPAADDSSERAGQALARPLEHLWLPRGRPVRPLTAGGTRACRTRRLDSRTRSRGREKKTDNSPPPSSTRSGTAGRPKGCELHPTITPASARVRNAFPSGSAPAPRSTGPMRRARRRTQMNCLFVPPAPRPSAHVVRRSPSGPGRTLEVGQAGISLTCRPPPGHCRNCTTFLPDLSFVSKGRRSVLLAVPLVFSSKYTNRRRFHGAVPSKGPRGQDLPPAPGAPLPPTLNAEIPGQEAAGT